MGTNTAHCSDRDFGMSHFPSGLIQNTLLPAGEKASKADQQVTHKAGDQSSSPSSPGCAMGSARSRRGASEPVMAGSPGRRTP
jgi:hypothetical protein